MRHIGIIQISPTLLADLLGLPHGTRILGFREGYEFFNSDGPVLQVKVEHDGLPCVPEGSEIKIVTPVYRQDATGIHFESWDKPE
jgi:hypothetical protein